MLKKYQRAKKSAVWRVSAKFPPAAGSSTGATAAFPPPVVERARLLEVFKLLEEKRNVRHE